MNIGKNIKKLRVEKGITQEQLAAHLGITYQAISKWETEANTPDISMLPEIARYFGISIDALFGMYESITPIADFIRDDDVVRIVQMRGSEVIKCDASDRPFMLVLPKEIDATVNVEIFGEANIEGDIKGDVVCHKMLECGNIAGDVTAKEYIECGNVAGNVRSEEYVACGNVAGSVGAGEYIECGNIAGRQIAAGDYIECGNIVGNVDVGEYIECGDIGGNISAGDYVKCDTIKTSETITCAYIECSGDINCEKIVYKQ